MNTIFTQHESSTFMLALVVLCSVCYLCVLGALIHAGLSKHRFGKRYIILKGATSAGFILLAFVASIWHGDGFYVFFLMLPSLLLCMAGDVLLAFANVHKKFFGKYFLMGAIAFAIGHAIFIVIFRMLTPTTQFWAWPMFILPIGMALFVYIAGKRNRRFRFGTMLIPGTIYAVCVGLMTSAAVRMCMFAGTDMRAHFIAAGGILFFVSDVILMFMYFYYKPRRVLRAFNFAAYYIGMMLIALAC